METNTMEINDNDLILIVKAYFELEKNSIAGELINQAYELLPTNLILNPAPPSTKMRQIRYFIMMNYLEIENRISKYAIEQIKQKSIVELHKEYKHKKEVELLMENDTENIPEPKEKKPAPKRKRITKKKIQKK